MTSATRHHRLISNIRVDPFEPAGQPAGFVPFWGRIADAVLQHGFGRFGEALRSASSSGLVFHSFKYLQQAPTLSCVTLRGKNTFTFEVHIVDEGVTAVRRGGHAVEPFLDLAVART